MICLVSMLRFGFNVLDEAYLMPMIEMQAIVEYLLMSRALKVDLCTAFKTERNPVKIAMKLQSSQVASNGAYKLYVISCLCISFIVLPKRQCALLSI